MGLFAGLLSLAALSLFFARLLRRSSALMPLLAIAAAMVFFTLAGCAGLLYAAGWAWYALCVVALGWVIWKEKRKTWALVSPGLVFFVGMGAFFILLFYFTRPMLTIWDEFTFWGTAAKTTSETNLLYTTARSSLIARSYPPGLIVYSYVMQFFGGFTEPGFIAAFAILPLAGFSAASALWGKNKTASVLFLAAMFLLPFLFETGAAGGQMALSYLMCLADAPMGVFFGGALCFYFAGGDKGARLMVPFAIVLAALVCIKDMGLALALIALFVAALDMLFCERKRAGFYRLRGAGALLCSWAVCLVAVVGAYLLWAAHLALLPDAVDRFDLGSGGQSLSMLAMLLNGVKALFGVGRSQQFAWVLQEMLGAFFTRPVMLLGSGAVVLCLVVVISALAFGFAPTKRQRRRVLVFTLGMAVCFAAFYIFNIFTYAYIFKWPEASVLKDYERYISPFWMGWMMGALCLLSGAVTHHRGTFRRLRAGRVVSGAVALGLTACVLLLGNRQANFLNISPSLYGQRQQLQGVAQQARQQGMQPQHTVYIVSQFDDGTHFYIYGLELEAVRVPVYYGPRLDDDGRPVTDDGAVVYQGNAAVTLTAPGNAQGEPYGVECTPEQLSAYLRQSGCTHVLVDRVDSYFVEAFGPMFSDGLQGWADDHTSRGHRYYQVQWQANGSCRLVAQHAEGGDSP